MENKNDQLKERSKSFLKKNNHMKRWMQLTLFLAVIAVGTTLYGVMKPGHSQEYTQKTLDCKYQIHQHTDDCYDKEGTLICGQCDYVVHTHNDDCYDENGKLVCALPEVKEHVHTDDCYEEEKVLVCGQEESDGHEHTSDCYEWVQGDLFCSLEEHVHTDDCYDEEGNLICGMEEHEHSDDCYYLEQVLTCGMEEGEGAHHHTNDCYETQKVAVCGENELHTHTDDCYDKDGNLICGKLELKEHTHDEDCFDTVNLSAEEVAEMQHEADKAASTESNSVVSETEESDSEAEEVTIGKTVDDDGTCHWTVETENYYITATYTDEAQIPDEAEFKAREITEDDEEYETYAQAYRESMGETAEINYIMDSGFYVDDEEIEPAAEVEVKVQAKDKEHALDGDENILHFKENDVDNTEVLDADKVSGESAIEYEVDGFSITVSGTLPVEVGGTVSLQGDKYGTSDSWTSDNTDVATVARTGYGSTATVTGKSTGTAKITHRFWNYTSLKWEEEYITITVKEAYVKVAVYASDGYISGKIDNSTLKEILGIPYQQKDSYFPIGVIELPKSLFTNQSSPYIRSEDNLNTVLNAFKTIDTTTLQNGGVANASNKLKEFAQDGTLSKYVQLNIYDGRTQCYDNNNELVYVGTAGSLTTALFDWNMGEWDDTTRATSNSTKNENTNIVTPNSTDGVYVNSYNKYCYKYHLDLRFATAKINYIGVYEDGTQTSDLASGVYLAGTEIEQPQSGALSIPNGYTADGYYQSKSGAQYKTAGNEYSFGSTMTANSSTTVYIRLVKTTSYTATKVWNHGDNPEANHPTTVTFKLYKTVNGVKTDTGRSVTLDGAADNSNKDDQETESWKASFTYLPYYEKVNGTNQEITYSVEEVPISGYDTSITTSGNSATVTNTYVPDTEADTPSITVTKKFEGITASQVPSGFKIDLTGKVSGSTTTSLTISGAEVSADKLTYSWKLDNIDVGDYAVSESNYNVDQYECETSGIGDKTISAKTINLDVSTQTADSSRTHSIGSGKNFVIAYTAGDSETGATVAYLIWTEEKLSASERAGLIAALNSKSGIGSLSSVSATTARFYSGENAKIWFRGKSIQYSGSSLTYNYAEAWDAVGYGTYSTSSTDTADIEVTNSYSYKPVIKLKKKAYDKNGSDIGPLSGIKFDVYKDGDTTKLDTYTSNDDGHLLNAEESDVTLEPGSYTLKEQNPPAGYNSVTIEITVNATGSYSIKSGSKQLTDSDIDAADGYYVIWNYSGYELPSTGGSGTSKAVMAGWALVIMALGFAGYSMRRKRERRLK